MLKKYSLGLVIFLCGILSGLGQVTTIDFEVANDGYTPSTTFGTTNIDAFNRTNVPINGNNTYHWVAEDLTVTNPFISLDQIDITGSTSFIFAVDFSYANALQWDSTDELIITYSLDGGTSQNLMAVQHINTDAFNNPAALDLDFDGDGDVGQELSISAFTTFTTSAIPLSGNTTLDITFQFNQLTGGGEGILIDNIVITETTGSPTCSITDIAITNPGTCNDNGTSADASDDYYLADVEITYSNPPASGTIDLTGSGVLGGVTSASVSGSIQTISGVQLAANGSDVEIIATFSDEITCNYTETVFGSAVSSCSGSGSACASIFSDDFSGTLSQWSNTTDWTISSGELKHNLSGIESESYTYADIGSQNFSSGDYQWEFCMRNGGWDPSGSNNFTYYLISDNSDLQSNATGYAVGVNRFSTNDFLTLYEVNGGFHTGIITSTLDWNSNNDVCIRVTRNTVGLWELFYSLNGGPEISAGTISNTSHVSGQYTGVFYDFSSTRAGQLWVDDINICSTLCSTPADTSVFTAADNCSSIDLSWAAPSCAEEVLIVAREGGAVTASPVGDGTAYIANSVFGTGGSGANLPANEFAVYKGSVTSASITGLANGNTYNFTIYSRTGTNWSTGISEFATVNFSVNNVPSFSAYNSCGNIALTWSLPTCYDDVLIVAREGGAVTASPVGDGTAYIANSVFGTGGSGANLPANEFAVYIGTTPPETITGLTDGITYHFKIFTRIGINWSSGVTSSATSVSSGGSGPTTFIPGDLVFVGFDSYIGGGNDRFSILNMVDIGVGTEFTMANLLYEYNAAAGVSNGRWYDCNDDFNQAGEPPYVTLQYNGCSNIPKGSIICIETQSFPAEIIGITVNGVDAYADFTFLDNATHSNDTIAGNISTSDPDAIWLMQGTFSDMQTEPDGPDTGDTQPDNFRTFTGVVLGGLQTKGNFQPFSLAGNAGGTRVSRIHPDIECVYLETGPTSNDRFYGYHDNLTSGTHYALLADITDVASNWVLQSASSGQTGDDIALKCGSSYTVTGSANIAGHWIGGVSTDWFDCKNWENFTVPKRDTNVTIDGFSIDDCDIDHTSPNAFKYGFVADCDNLTISDRTLIIDSDLDILYVDNVTIEGTGILDMDDSNIGTPDGLIYLYGNWTNSVGSIAFLEGNGTVVFSGTAPQIILYPPPLPPSGTEEFYNVILDNNFNTGVSNNLHANGNLTINVGNTLTVPSDNYVYVNYNVTNNGTFNIQNNGSLVQGDDSGVNTGNISMERMASIDAQDYVYWSSPVTGFNVNDVSPSSPTNRIYRWNPTFPNTNGTFGNWVSAAGDTMQEGVGYIIRVPNGQTPPPMPGDLNFTATFNNGVPHNGVITPTVSHGGNSGSEDDDWNLVGNPYPSAIDAYTFLSESPNNVLLDGFVNLWTHGNPPSTGTIDPFYYDFVSNYTAADYITYNVLGGSYGPGDILIAAGQSFMVNMLDTAPTSSTIEFNNSMRDKSYDNSLFYKSTNNEITLNRTEEKHRIWLDLAKSNQVVNRILVGYAENATMERDRLYDAIADNLSFYSLINDKAFVIQGRELPFIDSDRVPLGMQLTENGNYNIAIAIVDGLFETENQTIYLKDHLLGVIHNLTNSPYSFNSEAGVVNDRFEIVFNNASLSVDDYVVNSNDLTIIELTNGDVKFSLHNSNYTIASVEIIDLLGRKLYHLKGTNSTEVYSLSNLSSSAYIAKITLSNGQVISKKAIKRY